MKKQTQKNIRGNDITDGPKRVSKRNSNSGSYLRRMELKRSPDEKQGQQHVNMKGSVLKDLKGRKQC